MINEDVFLNEPWLKWAVQIQSIAQAGLTYSESNYDLDRYRELRDISAEMLSYKTGISKEKVKEIFCNETGYQTPKIDTRAAIFKDNKILLVHENNDTWSLPGGWCEVLESILTNTIKESKEEAGLDVKPVKLVAVQDRNKHNKPIYAYGVCKVFIECEALRRRVRRKHRNNRN